MSDPVAPPAATPSIGLVAVGDPESPATWSGTTAGILGALRSLGVRTQTLDLALAPRAERVLLAAGAARTLNRYDADGAALTMGLRGRLARRRVGAWRADGIIQIGTNFALPADCSYVTLEDMTLRQGASFHPVFSRMSAHGIAGWETRRAAIYARARMCCAGSRWTARSLVEDYGVEPRRVAVVGLGANHESSSARRPPSVPRFLFVGIDWQRKGGPLLLRAFAAVRERFPDATLDLVGGHPAVEQPGVSAHGVLSQARPAERQRLAELFARATCLVVPSNIEPFGIVYVEAAAAGLPSIVSAVGGARDIIGSDGGVAVEPGDEDGLLSAMLRLCDPATAARMGEAARSRAGLYTWTAVAERLLRALGVPSPGGAAQAEFL